MTPHSPPAPSPSLDRGFLTPPAGRRGLAAWIFSTDHKRIGLMYLACITTLFLAGVCLGLVMRLKLITPGNHLLAAQTYNAVFTLHGVIMIFLVVIPSIPASFGNILLPLHLGAGDVSFPRLNLLSWWLYVTGAVVALISIFTGTGAPDTGWTFYVPFSERTTTNVSVAVSAVFILGFSSILTGLNFVTTIHQLRAPGMTWRRLSLFVWSLYATAWIQVLATPILGITVLLIFAERVLGLGLFDPGRGGDPLLYQHLFWIYSHPAVYIMILPAMGVVSDIIPVFARKRIFGYKMIAFSSLAIAFVGSLVWAHHMFTSGMSDLAVLVFSFLTFIVAVPSAIKVFNWLSTLYKGSITLHPPLLYTLGFIWMFSVGGLTGLVQGAAGADIHVHDTYFIVAHFHYVIFGGTGLGMFAAMHFWFPKIFGRLYHLGRAKLAFWIILLGMNVLYFPMFILGLMGMPRRYYDYLPQFATGQFISTLGSWILALGLGLMFYNLYAGIRRGAPAGPNPWGAATLEWSLPSPPPSENFALAPVVDKGPYDFYLTAAMPEHHQDYAGAKLGMWLFLFTELLLFGGLFLLYASYLHRYAPDFHLAAKSLDTFLGAANTVILITSSLCVAMAISALQQGRPRRCLGLLALTVLLGLSFLVNKGFEWGQKFEHGLYPGAPHLQSLPRGQEIFYSLYFAMTGLHGLHVLVGALLLCTVMVLVRRGRVHSHDFVILENAGLYWHLVDLIWIFLFPLFYLIT